MSTATSAFLLLADFTRRLRDNAHDLPSQQDMVQYWSGIGFMLDGVHYVSPIDEVAEVLSIPDYTRIPGVHPWMKGVSNVRGRLMAVMDLTVFLNKISSLKAQRRRLMVIDENDLYTGMAVDEVLGMQHFPVTDFVDQWMVDTDVAPYVCGAYARDGSYWPVFSLRLLAEDPRFLQVSRAG